MRSGVGVVVAGALLLSGCGMFSHSHRRAPAPPPEPGATQEGIASWYGPGFHGRPTSSGEIYNQYGLTAAHQTLAAGTRVRVTNLTNRRAVVVRINDRGPFVDDRIIDLSYAAARELEMIGPGTAPVRLEILGPGPVDSVQVAAAPPRVIAAAASAAALSVAPPPKPRRVPGNNAAAPVAALHPSRYAVQVAAFSDYDRARRTQRLLEQQGAPARLGLVEEAGMRYYRLRLGPYNRPDDAARTAERINALGYPALVVADATWQ